MGQRHVSQGAIVSQEEEGMYMHITQVTAKETVGSWKTGISTDFIGPVTAWVDWGFFWLWMVEGTAGNGLCDFGKNVFGLGLCLGSDGICQCDGGRGELQSEMN
jgi:hypothetical protein